jgi:hypothetical protein
VVSLLCVRRRPQGARCGMYRVCRPFRHECESWAALCLSMETEMEI